jgi:hypothetical protein
MKSGDLDAFQFAAIYFKQFEIGWTSSRQKEPPQNQCVEVCGCKRRQSPTVARSVGAHVHCANMKIFTTSTVMAVTQDKATKPSYQN